MASTKTYQRKWISTINFHENRFLRKFFGGFSYLFPYPISIQKKNDCSRINNITLKNVYRKAQLVFMKIFQVKSFSLEIFLEKHYRGKCFWRQFSWKKFLENHFHRHVHKKYSWKIVFLKKYLQIAIFKNFQGPQKFIQFCEPIRRN